MNAETPEVAAATVVLGRDGADGFEVLMLKRATTTSFAGELGSFPEVGWTRPTPGRTRSTASRRPAARRREKP